MKRELMIIAIALYWACLLGVLLPAFISSTHTELVVAGGLLLLVSTYILYRVVRREYHKEKAK